MALGALSPSQAWDALGDLAPTAAFLAALLVLAEACSRAGLFDALGTWLAAGSRGSPSRLLALVFGVAAVVTAVLSLDATVLLLTPVVLATALRLRTAPRPHVYASAHLANSASLLLPVSNLTNLLAFHASGLSFARFAALMAAPWAGAIAVEWAVLRRTFRADLRGAGRRARRATRAAAALRARGPGADARRVRASARSPGSRRCGSRWPVRSRWRCGCARRRWRSRGGRRRGSSAFVLALGVIVAAAAAKRPDGRGPGAAAVRRGAAAAPADRRRGGGAGQLVNNLPATLVLVPAPRPRAARARCSRCSSA